MINSININWLPPNTKAKELTIYKNGFVYGNPNKSTLNIYIIPATSRDLTKFQFWDPTLSSAQIISLRSILSNAIDKV